MGDLFRSAGYNEARVKARTGVEPVSGPSHADLPAILHATREMTPLDVLSRLFTFGVEVPEADARRAFDPIPLEAVQKAGLIATRDDRVSASIAIRPVWNLWIACDITTAGADAVMTPSVSSFDLARAVVRSRRGRALDLGTGSGFQALLMTTHCDTVAATDVNERALHLGRFNAALNGQDVEFLRGSLFEPVAGRSFDLIVGNLPFLISPESRFEFRDSGMEADGFAEAVIRQAGGHLEAGGLAQFIFDSANLDGSDSTTRVAAWCQGSGCDAWLLQGEAIPVTQYATVWLKPLAADRVACREAFDNWMRYYDRLRIESITPCILTLRRRRGANWFRVAPLPQDSDHRAGEAIELGFALRDYLDSVDDRALFDSRMRASPAARLEQVCEPARGGWSITSATLRLDSGLPFRAKIDSLGAALVARSDGLRTLNDVVSGLASELGLDPSSLASGSAGVVRKLVEQGFLIPEHLVH